MSNERIKQRAERLLRGLELGDKFMVRAQFHELQCDLSGIASTILRYKDRLESLFLSVDHEPLKRELEEIVRRGGVV